MARFVILLAVAGVTAVLLWPDEAERPEPAPRAVANAPQPTGPLARGVERSRAVITVRRGDREYELRGGLDLTEGYRFRGRVTVSSDDFLEDGTPIWLAGGRGTWARMPRHYDTMTKSTLGRGEPIWLDDHPPTLALTRDPFAGAGAEVYAHLALLAIKHGVHGYAFDFGAYTRRPPSYSDLRRTALAAGETQVDVDVGDGGLVERLRFDVRPAAVEVRLFPSDRAVGPLKLRRFAME